MTDSSLEHRLQGLVCDLSVPRDWNAMRIEVLSVCLVSVAPVSRAGHGAWDQASHHLCKGLTGTWQDRHGQLTSTKDMAQST